MKRAAQFAPVIQQVFLWFVFIALSGILARPQDISIRVLNGRNGKPITDECINVSLGSWHGADLLLPTTNGIAMLHIRGNQITGAAPSSSCNGQAIVGPKPFSKGVDTIAVATDYYKSCQEYGKIDRGEPATQELLKEIVPSYSINTILKDGASAGNTCGKIRVQPKPGELILFVRPTHWWQRMRR